MSSLNSLTRHHHIKIGTLSSEKGTGKGNGTKIVQLNQFLGGIVQFEVPLLVRSRKGLYHFVIPASKPTYLGNDLKNCEACYADPLSTESDNSKLKYYFVKKNSISNYLKFNKITTEKFQRIIIESHELQLNESKIIYEIANSFDLTVRFILVVNLLIRHQCHAIHPDGSQLRFPIGFYARLLGSTREMIRNIVASLVKLDLIKKENPQKKSCKTLIFSRLNDDVWAGDIELEDNLTIREYLANI